MKATKPQSSTTIDAIQAGLTKALQQAGYKITAGTFCIAAGKFPNLHVYYADELHGGNSLQRGYRQVMLSRIK